MTSIFKSVVSSLLAATSMAVLATSVQAQALDYPNKPVSIIVSFPPGGIASQGATPAPSTSEELAGLVTTETARWGKVVRDGNITVN